MSEPLLRLTCFAGVLITMAGAEAFAPRRALRAPKTTRWLNHFSLGLLSTVLLWLLFPVAAVGVAAMAQEKGWGLLNHWRVEDWVVIAGSMVALDFLIYLQHRVFHTVPLFWRFHRVHHADLDLDVSSGIRFHPVEIGLSMLLKMLAVLALGAPPTAVIAFEILLNATSLFNHSNIAIPVPLDRILRMVIVTPDMHRVHHSAIASETNHNFSFNLPWWDRLLGTYQGEPSAGQKSMTLGLAERQDAALDQLPQLLLLPFRS